ncbi:MAG: hypothetical protein KKA07_18725 [Bacteroidetes bacterium]|nr:hypothetical protein [Bacteroidota bacterium]MBU1721107.1 hypothetical protein [Bacteroidota bacterium]
MRLALLPVFFLTVFLTVSSAQTLDLNKRESPSKSTKAIKHKNIGLKNAGNDECVEACAGCCIELVASNMIPLMIDYQEELLNKRDLIPRTVSLDFMPHFSVDPTGSYCISPRLKGNWALFSTELRYNYMIQDQSFFGTTDWQFILNPLITEFIDMGVGTGIMYETSSGEIFNESTAFMNGYINENRVTVGGEFRAALDYTSASVPRMEANFRVGYLVLNTPNFYGWLTTGFSYQEYYQTTQHFGILVGFSLNLH